MRQVNKAELVATVADNLEMAKSHVDSVITEALDVIKSNLKSGRKVNLKGFAKFYLKKYGPRKVRNFTDGNRYEIGERILPTAELSESFVAEFKK